MTPAISVILCTKNRLANLEHTLGLIGRAEIPAGLAVEVLVVDNGSTDGTADFVRQLRLPNAEVRHVFERGPGKSFAYNAGLEVARGDILLCTDDDVRVPANWIEGMCRPILEGQADAVAGGVTFSSEVRERLDASPLRQRKDWVASTERIEPDNVDHMVGANMAFHRRVLARVPRFDVELGPGGLGNGEDTLWSWQIMAAGFRVVSRFDIAAEHHFDLSRLNHDAVLEMGRKLARSHAFLRYHWEHRRPRWLGLKLAGALFRRWVGRATRSGFSERALHAEEDVAYYREFLRQRRRPHKYAHRDVASQAPE